MGKLILYGTLLSPPVRATLLTLSELKLDFEFKEVDVHSGETRSDEFLKKNPQHTVPVLEDDGDYIWDSHAIIAYLVRKYASNDALYPKDFYQRAVIDQRLHFESGVLFGRCIKGLFNPANSHEENVQNIEEAYDFLELLLENSYMAGEGLTIADFSIVSSATSLNAIVPLEANKKRPKLSAWIELMKQLPYYEEANAKGLEILSERVKTMKIGVAAN